MRAVDTATTEMGAGNPDGNAIPQLGPGKTLGRYRILSPLGTGGMGAVFRAHDPSLARDVAIKLLRGTQTAERAQRLIREAQAMARVKHANLVAIYDVGEQDGDVYLAMELVEGGSLRAWMKNAARPLKARVEAIEDIAAGLAAAHAAGLVHRDLKPENVLVESDGQMKVADFGLARSGAGAVGSGTSGDGAVISDDPLSMTLTGSLVGTPLYMAPEQHAGAPADARSDQFSLAVVAWEVIWGQRPFAGDTYEQLATAVRSGTVTPPPRRGGVDGRLERVLRRALEVDPAARYPSVAALGAAITRAASSKKVPAAFASLVAIALIAAFAWKVGVSPATEKSDKPASTTSREPPPAPDPDRTRTPKTPPDDRPVKIAQPTHDGSGSGVSGDGSNTSNSDQQSSEPNHPGPHTNITKPPVPSTYAIADLDKVVRDNAATLRRCPASSGHTWELALVIDKDGNVTSAAFAGKTGEVTSTCLPETVKTWKFPALGNDSTVKLRVPVAPFTNAGH